MDPVLSVLLLIKNGWSLTESGLAQSDISFSSGWYTQDIALPQITVTSQPGGSMFPLEMGPTPMYYFGENLTINVWVKPESQSNKSLGAAKHKEYAIRREISRILRSGSHLNTGDNNEEFLYLIKWRRMDEKDPILLRSTLTVTDNYFREIYENTP